MPRLPKSRELAAGGKLFLGRAAFHELRRRLVGSLENTSAKHVDAQLPLDHVDRRGVARTEEVRMSMTTGVTCDP